MCQEAKLIEALQRIEALLSENLGATQNTGSLYNGQKVSKKASYQMALGIAQEALTSAPK